MAPKFDERDVGFVDFEAKYFISSYVLAHLNVSLLKTVTNF